MGKSSYSIHRLTLPMCVLQSKRVALDDKRLNIVVFFV